MGWVQRRFVKLIHLGTAALCGIDAQDSRVSTEVDTFRFRTSECHEMILMVG